MSQILSRLKQLSPSERTHLLRIVTALVLFVGIELIPLETYLPSDQALWVSFLLFLIPYLIAGADVLLKSVKGMLHRDFLDENILMSIATIGAFALVLFPEADPHMAEGAAVMIFYQIGEWFQDYAVHQSHDSIQSLMDIAPEYAWRQDAHELVRVAPKDLRVGDIIMVKPGERIAADGEVIEGYSQLDTAAITGEALPRLVHIGSQVVSGCINLTGAISIRVATEYQESTVQRIMDLVEHANSRKALAETFITRIARIYTPIVVVAALLLASIPPLLLGDPFSLWIQRALVFLVVSCPCALVISVPLSFFGGLGATSKLGVLVKGSNFLEALSACDTIAFDKTGTLTTGKFGIVTVHPTAGIQKAQLLRIAAHIEVLSNHPCAQALRQAYTAGANPSLVSEYTEYAGKGVSAVFEGARVMAGNQTLLEDFGIRAQACEVAGTCIYLAREHEYLGHIVIADAPKDDASQTISHLHTIGIKNCVMLTGDRKDTARAIAQKLGMDSFFAELLPDEKVGVVETLIQEHKDAHNPSRVAFVGDGINDAPVIMRADVGIAMGAMGSDAAIEAADIVLMNDKPSSIACSILIARKTMEIVWQNIALALGIKILILILAATGHANMWMAVFGDVGVTCLAVANAMRALYAHTREHLEEGL